VADVQLAGRANAAEHPLARFGGNGHLAKKKRA
jgi:hypothetical protein